MPLDAGWVFVIACIGSIGVVSFFVFLHNVLTDNDRIAAGTHRVSKRTELELARVSAREFITVNVARDLMLAAMHRARSAPPSSDVATVQAMLTDRPR